MFKTCRNPKQEIGLESEVSPKSYMLIGTGVTDKDIPSYIHGVLVMLYRMLSLSLLIRKNVFDRGPMVLESAQRKYVYLLFLVWALPRERDAHGCGRATSASFGLPIEHSDARKRRSCNSFPLQWLQNHSRICSDVFFMKLKRHTHRR